VGRDKVVQRRRNALGFCTKELCSGLFVSGREAKSLIEADLAVICDRFAGGVLHPGEIDFSIDYEHRSVTGRLSDGTCRRAVYSGDKGAALVAGQRRDLAGMPVLAGYFDDRSWPGGDGFEPDPGYSPLRSAIRDHLAGTAARGVAVVHHGRLVAQEFAPGFGPTTPTRGWSTAKTLTGLVVGLLAGQGVVDPAAPAGIASWKGERDPRSRISLLDLLRLQSGLSMRRAPDGSEDMLTDADDYFAAYCRPVSVEAMVSEVDFATSGVFCYQSIDFLAIAVALREKLGPAIHGHLSGTVLPALGLRHSLLETDAEGTPLLSGSWYTTPADLARIGQIILGRGKLGGRRVVTESWTALMRAESPAIVAGRVTGPPAFRHPYGAGLWLNHDGHLPAAPRAMSYALGSLGQGVFILDEEDLVIARTGLDPEPGHPALITAVLAALSRCEVDR